MNSNRILWISSFSKLQATFGCPDIDSHDKWSLCYDKGHRTPLLTDGKCYIRESLVSLQGALLPMASISGQWIPSCIFSSTFDKLFLRFQLSSGRCFSHLYELKYMTEGAREQNGALLRVESCGLLFQSVLFWVYVDYDIVAFSS